MTKPLNNAEKSSEYSRPKLLIFGMYVIESLATFAIFTYLSYYLNNVLGINPIWIGIFGGIALIPMVLKWIIAFIMDSVKLPFLSGRYRPYLFIGTVMNVIGLAFLFLHPLQFLVPFWIFWIVQSFGIAIIDVGADAVATGVKRYSSPMRMAVIGFLGIFIGGIAALILAGVFEANYSFGFIITALFSCIGLLIVWFFKDKAPARGISLRETLSAVKQEIKRRKVLFGIILAGLLMANTGLLDFNLERFVWLEFGMPLRVFTALIIIPAFIGSIAAILIAWFTLGKVKTQVNEGNVEKPEEKRQPSIKRAAIPYAIMIFLYFLGQLIWTIFIFMGAMNLAVFLPIFIVFGLLEAIALLFYTAIFYDLSNPKVGASMIMIFFALINAGRISGMIIGGFLYYIHPGLVFLVASLLSLSSSVPLILLILQESREK